MEATFENGALKSVETIAGNETQSLYSGVERTLFPQFISNQSADDIDVITGATYACNAVISIMTDIFSQAAQ